jgi:Domain of unknown function (DUF4190)
VVTDHKSSKSVTEFPSGSAIENELPTYRAISPRAVLSLLCGLMSLFTIANPFFYVFAVLAIVLGYTADRNIKRYPDMLTGRGLAQAGAALGLVFGLGIFTVSTVQGMVRSRNASSFARHYGEVAKDRTLGDLLWLGIPPGQRTSVSPEEVMKKMSEAQRKDAAVMEMKNAGIRNLKRRLDSSKDQEIHFVRLEKEGVDGLTSIAVALFELHGPPTKDFPAKEEYAMVLLKGTSQRGKGYEWWAEEVSYPYKPQTADLPEKTVDDGHGHAH